MRVAGLVIGTVAVGGLWATDISEADNAVNLITLRELVDLVEFLARQKQPGEGESHEKAQK
jgi:ketopantoate reductase